MSEHATRLDDDVTIPSVTATGDGPADTTDPDELASSADPKPGEAATVAGTVNAVVPIGRRPQPRTEWSDEDRVEREQVTLPDGSTATRELNVDLGESRLVTDAATS